MHSLWAFNGKKRKKKITVGKLHQRAWQYFHTLLHLREENGH